MSPSEIYNMGAMSHVKVLIDMPKYTADCDGVGVLQILDRSGSSGLEKEITATVANVHLGIRKCLYLGNIDALKVPFHSSLPVDVNISPQNEARDHVVKGTHTRRRMTAARDGDE
eukprot:CAMPEP_0172496754 /NCGR_PEP_ID=MMETSP1066-20121228/92426_1 /TAXON_ID=671091 /ORGANISM="Coscinodiscus wailesii, Strain CCMP2513" /LENGTH=114 /DNA_ID=CAMNT_0013269205 /DNA_START=167 /DNA_END=512 /DNA_ORIENTATION=+